MKNIFKELRNKHHYSQQHVADYLGIPRSTYTHLEKNYDKITYKHLKKLMQLYGVEAHTIFGIEDYRNEYYEFFKSMQLLIEQTNLHKNS